MIKFIQRYQKIFYIIVTVMIVISFSFFGTSGVIDGPSLHDQIAFTALDGTKVSRGELEQISYFLQTDLQDKRIYQQANMSPNFLNDGVIQKDFLETGIANLLIEDYADLLRADLNIRSLKERSFKPYVHPQVSFVSAEMVWDYVSPTMRKDLRALQATSNPLTPEALQTRINLYLAERHFPAPYLTELLWRQQSQHEWIQKDENLPYLDLSLFGYHTLDDWFGPKFSRLVAEFIYNAALMAEQKGYRVTKEEAWADLVKNSQISYAEMSRAKLVGGLSQSEYLDQQLRRMSMDKGMATKIWQKVLLFRRLFHDVANSSLVEPKTLALTNAWASEYVSGDLYQLPKALHLSDLLDLAEFEHYLASVSKNQGLIPNTVSLKATEVLKSHPEFVEKRYLAVIKKADLKTLESRIPLRETWAWEAEGANFNRLKKEFADLGIVEGSTLEARVTALDSLPDPIRLKVDNFARHEIALGKKEWVENALSQSEGSLETLVVRLKGGNDPLVGLKDRKKLIETLDQAPLNQETRLMGDNVVYQIRLIDRSPEWEVVTYEEAKQSGALSESLVAELTPFYSSIRSQHDEKFKKESGDYKNLNEVKRQVVELWLQPKMKEIQKSAGKTVIADLVPTLRFVSWANKVRDSQDKSAFLKEETVAEVEPDKLPPKASWGDQFKWERSEKKYTRGSEEGTSEKETLFTLKPQEWSSLLTPPNGDITFFYVKERKAERDPDLLVRQTLSLRSGMGQEEARLLMATLLAEMKEKGAISFDYLNQETETMEVTPTDV